MFFDKQSSQVQNHKGVTIQIEFKIFKLSFLEKIKKTNILR